MEPSISALQDILGKKFTDPALLRMALTHASTAEGLTYERLEFLGDRVLGMAVAEILYDRFPKEPEGDLARRLAALVQGTTLAEIARDIQLGDYINLSDAESRAGGGDNDHILADVLEAILGALYLDQGFKACQEVITTLWGDRIYDMLRPPQHPKTTVQEWAQSQGLPLPQYDIIDQSGPDHAPEFKVEISVNGYPSVTAIGKSRQEAEKAAALAFMKQQGL